MFDSLFAEKKHIYINGYLLPLERSHLQVTYAELLIYENFYINTDDIIMSLRDKKKKRKQMKLFSITLEQPKAMSMKFSDEAHFLSKIIKFLILNMTSNKYIPYARF